MIGKQQSAKARVLTSGEVADYCSVHFRTVIRWIEKGKLKAYKLPGRGNNRIEEKDFIDFLKENDMPIPSDFQQDNKRILIVDDLEEMASMIQRVLKKDGYETMIARDGFQAGAMLASFQPALMTLDLSMPNMDGFSVLKFVRQQPGSQAVKILVVSALDDTKLAAAKTAGAHACLAKPFKAQTLLDTIAELLASD